METNSQKYVYIASLGCPKNFVDTEVMAASLLQKNIGITAELEDADMFLINTCAFITPARDEAQSVIEEAIDWKSEASDRLIVVSGCLIQWDRDESYKDLYPEVDLWLGIDEVPNFAEHATKLFEKRINHVRIMNSDPEYLYDELTPRIQLTLPHYAHVKISEGCNNWCTYCSIPAIRGTLRSRSVASVAKEVSNLINNDIQELIIISQDSTSFGCDNSDEKENFAELLKKLDSIDGDFWLRIFYSHPASFTDELISIFKNATHILPYIEIPLQHISDPILKAMKRKVTSSQTRELIKKLKSEIPGLILRTTFIVGFPGETEEDFQELYDFIEETEFDRLGVFCYFREPRTAAYDLPDQVDPEISQDRADRLMELQSKISLKKNKALVGKVFDVIIDTANEMSAVGRTYMDAPEIDNSVIIEGDKLGLCSGDIVKVKFIEASEYDMKGEIVN